MASPLRSYTGGDANAHATGTTVDEALRDLDRQYPGLRFRIVDERGNIRQHLNMWLDGERVRDLAVATDGRDELVIMQALSGG